MISVLISDLVLHFQSLWFQTSPCWDQDRALPFKRELRLSRIHRTPGTKLSNKTTYNYTTVKPQLATVAVKFFPVWPCPLSPIWDPLFRFVFMSRRTPTSSAPRKPVSSVNAKGTAFPVAARIHPQQHSVREHESPDILWISGDGIIHLPFPCNEFDPLLYLIVLLIKGIQDLCI